VEDAKNKLIDAENKSKEAEATKQKPYGKYAPVCCCKKAYFATVKQLQSF
jgi:hypothetical protein